MLWIASEVETRGRLELGIEGRQWNRRRHRRRRLAPVFKGLVGHIGAEPTPRLRRKPRSAFEGFPPQQREPWRGPSRRRLSPLIREQAACWVLCVVGSISIRWSSLQVGALRSPRAFRRLQCTPKAQTSATRTARRRPNPNHKETFSRRRCTATPPTRRILLTWEAHAMVCITKCTLERASSTPKAHTPKPEGFS